MYYNLKKLKFPWNIFLILSIVYLYAIESYTQTPDYEEDSIPTVKLPVKEEIPYFEVDRTTVFSLDELKSKVKTMLKKEYNSEKGRGFIEFQDDSMKVFGKLHKIDEEKLRIIGDSLYFVCANFKGKNGILYDLDLFMKSNTIGSLDISEIHIHKKDGKVLFDWKEAEGKRIKFMRTDPGP